MVVSNKGTITNEKIAKIDLTENEQLLPNEIIYVEIIKPKNKLPLSPINILALGLLNNKNTEVKIIKKIDNNCKKKLSITIELYNKVDIKKNRE